METNKEMLEATVKGLQDKLEQLQTELEKQNVIVVNTDNKQTQVNNTNGTVSVGKETTPNDQTFKTLQLQYGIP